MGEGSEEGKTVAGVRDWLVRALAKELKLSPEEIDPHEPFTRLGADSLTLVTVGGDLEAWLERSIPPSVMWEYPTIASLAAALMEGPEAAQQEGERAGPGSRFGVELEDLSDEELEELLASDSDDGE